MLDKFAELKYNAAVNAGLLSSHIISCLSFFKGALSLMRVRGRPESAFIRFFLVLVATTGGWILLGSVLLVGGLVWGLNSHQVTYIQGGQGNYQIYVSEDNSFLCFQQGTTNNYYVMMLKDYPQALDLGTIQNDIQAHNRFTFTASTESTQLNSEVKGSGAFISSALPIEQITFYNNQGANPITYTSTRFAGNPNGYAVNNWPFAGPMALAGAIGAGAALYILISKRRRLKLAQAKELTELEARPSPFARELRE